MPLVKPAWPILQRGDPLSIGLVGAWPFFEGSGNRVQDLSGKNNNGSFINGPTWVGGEFGSAINFDGTSQYVNLNSTINWNTGSSNGTPITFAAWINTPGGTAGGGFGAFSSETPMIGAHIPYNDTIYWCYDNFSAGYISFNMTAYFNKWTFIVLTNDGAAAKAIYLDGKVVASNTTPNGAGATDVAHIANIGTFGGGGGGTYYYNGKISDVKIYNRVLSDSEIAQLYFDGLSIYRPKRRVPWFTIIGGGAGSQNLSPSLFTNSSTFFAATVTAGAVNLTPSLFTSTNTFFAPTVATAGNLAPSLFTNANTFFSPTIGRGVVNLAPTLFANSNIFYSPTVAVAQPQTILPSLFTNTSTFFLPIVRSHIVLINVYVKLLAPHVFDAIEWPTDTIFGPDQSKIPVDFQYTPLMEGLSGDSATAIAQVKVDIFGRYDSHGNLLDNPPIPRPIYDPQPTPPVGNKHILPLGNTC